MSTHAQSSRLASWGVVLGAPLSFLREFDDLHAFAIHVRDTELRRYNLQPQLSSAAGETQSQSPNGQRELYRGPGCKAGQSGMFLRFSGTGTGALCVVRSQEDDRANEPDIWEPVSHFSWAYLPPTSLSSYFEVMTGELKCEFLGTFLGEEH